MGYAGKTYNLPCNEGGLNHNSNIDMVPPVMMVHPSRNLDLSKGGRGKRGGTAHVNSTTISGSPKVIGLHDFTLVNGNQFLVMATNDGKLWKNFTTTIKTGLTADSITSMEVFSDKVYFSNGANIPQSWDGSAGSTSDLTNVPTDWTGANYPKQIIKHGKGNSERLWALGCPSTPHTIYASDNGTDDFSDANVTTFNIETGDGIGIVGGVEFGDRIIVFSKKRAYVIDDTSSTASEWGYSTAQWEGGVANHRLIIKTPTDIVCMTDDGDIYSIGAAESYGDYKAGSIAKPSHIDRWIREHVNLSLIDQFHAVYDPQLRAIKFFMIRNGQSSIDMALVYYIDRGPQEGWMVHDNQNDASGYAASCSTVYKVSSGDFRIYTGGYNGFVWTLEEATKSDDGAGYYAGWRTPYMTMENLRLTKHFRRGWIVTEPQGDYNLSVYAYVDGTQGPVQLVSLSGAGGVLDSFLLDTDSLGGTELLDKTFDVGDRGKRIAFEVFNSKAGEDFFVSSMQIDFKTLGARPS